MASTKEENIVQYGPYGNQLQASLFSMKIDGDEVIKEVIIRHGYCVDAIGFVVGGKTVLSGGLRGTESKSLTITIMSYMKTLRIAVGAEKGYIDAQKFNSSLENAFQLIYKGAMKNI